MLGYEQTEAGTHVATPELVAWWESRDTCPLCSAIVEPIGETGDEKRWAYRCDCDETFGVTWTREK